MTIPATEPVPCLCGHALTRHAPGAEACLAPLCGCGSYRQHGGGSPRRVVGTTPAELRSAQIATAAATARIRRELDVDGPAT